MATVIPNRAGEAIQRSSENLVNLIMQAHRLNLDRQQLAQQAEQFDRQQSYIEAGRPHNFITQRLNQLQPGQTPREAGIPDEMWVQAGLTGINQDEPWTPETLQSIKNKMAVEHIRSGLDPNMQQRMINMELYGRADPDSVFALQDLVTETNFAAASEKVLSMSDRDFDRIGGMLFGLEDVEFQFGGRTFRYESAQAGSLALGHLQYQLAQSELSQRSSDEMLRYREALKVRMEESGVTTFGLGNARARAESERILAGYYNDPASVESIADPNARAFVEAQLSSRDLADNSLLTAFRNTEQGQAYFGMLELGEQLGQFLPKEEVGQALQSITNTMSRDLGIPIARMEQRGLFRDDRIVLPGGSPTEAADIEIPPDLADDPQAVEALRAGVPVEFIRGSRNTVVRPTTHMSPPTNSTPLPRAIQARVDSLSRQISEQEARIAQAPANPSAAQRAALDRSRRNLEALRRQRDSYLTRGEVSR